VAAAQLRGERDRDGAADVAAREVVDVVVLGDDEALPLAGRVAVEAAVQLEDHGPPLERQLGRVGVRQVDHARGPVGTDVAEPAAVTPGRDVRDDVELLAGVEERLLEQEVVARRDEQLVRRATVAQDGRHRREEAVDGGRRGRDAQHRVQLVVQRPGPLH